MKFLKQQGILFFVLFLTVNPVEGAVDTSTFAGVSQNMSTFVLNLSVVMNNILTDPQLMGIIDMMWKAFAVVLIITVMSKFALYGVSTDQIVYVVLMISFTRLLIDYYDGLTSMMWGWSEGFAGGIQRAALGTTDVFFVPGMVNDVWSNVSINDVGIFDGFSTLLAVAVFSIFGILLSVLSLFAATWALWGYALAKLIGWIFIPFIMFKQLSFLFDGWLRLFMGFLVYGIVARVNLVMVAISMKAFLGLPSYTIPVGFTLPISINFFSDIFGMVVFLFIGVLALFATGRFAAAIAGGVGGFGEGMRGFMLGTSRIFK